MPRLPHPRTALSALADDRLGPVRSWSVRRHLERCTRCELEVAQIRSLRDLLAAPEPPPVHPELLGRLLDIGGTRDPQAPDAPDAREPADVPEPLDLRDLDPSVPGRPPVTAGEPVVPPVARVPAARRHRGSVGAAGVLVAGVVLVGAAGTGAVMTSAPGTWQGTGARASLTTVLPRLFPGEAQPAGAVSERPVDNGSRP